MGAEYVFRSHLPIQSHMKAFASVEIVALDGEAD